MMLTRPKAIKEIEAQDRNKSWTFFLSFRSRRSPIKLSTLHRNNPPITLLWNYYSLYIHELWLCTTGEDRDSKSFFKKKSVGFPMPSFSPYEILPPPKSWQGPSKHNLQNFFKFFFFNYILWINWVLELPMLK